MAGTPPFHPSCTQQHPFGLASRHPETELETFRLSRYLALTKPNGDFYIFVRNGSLFSLSITLRRLLL